MEGRGARKSTNHNSGKQDSDEGKENNRLSNDHFRAKDNNIPNVQEANVHDKNMEGEAKEVNRSGSELEEQKVGEDNNMSNDRISKESHVSQSNDLEGINRLS